MTKQSKTVVFFGSGPLAAKSLELLAKDFEIEAVITKSTPPGHKGEVPVLELSKKIGLKIHSVDSRRQLDDLIKNVKFVSESAILIDFGIIVSQNVIDYFKKGIINSHFSILPEWRGADPISFSLLSGQETTGVSLMLLVEAMDEGPLLSFAEISIEPDFTSPILSEKLVELSDSLIKEIVPLYLDNELSAQPQTITGRDVCYSRKLTKQDGIIDWIKPAQTIEREIRTFIDWPKSHATIGSLEVIITSAHASPSINTNPGEFKIDGDKLLIQCGDNSSLSIDKLKPSGKPEMPIKAFLLGYKSRLV
jgi:methionyl-tRNA formyltransferase